MNGQCEYEFDGKDTDSTKWYRCTTHNEMALSPDAPCAGYQEIPYGEPAEEDPNTIKNEDITYGSKEEPINDLVESITIAGPGFLNFKLTEKGLKLEDQKLIDKLNQQMKSIRKDEETNNSNTRL